MAEERTEMQEDEAAAVAARKDNEEGFTRVEDTITSDAETPEAQVLDFSSFDPDFEGPKTEVESEPEVEKEPEVAVEEGEVEAKPETPPIVAEGEKEAEAAIAAQVKPEEGKATEEESPELSKEQLMRELLTTQKTLLEIQEGAKAAEVAAKAPSPEEFAAQYQKTRDVAVKGLVEQYKLSEEDSELMRTEPESVLPKLAAEVTLTTVQQVLHTVYQELPGFVSNALQAKDAKSDEDQAFYTMWPLLDKSEYHKSIGDVGELYRKLNPNASVEDYRQHVGVQASAMLKVPIQRGGAEESMVKEKRSLSSLTPKRKSHRPLAAKAAATSPPETEGNIFSTWTKEEELEQLG